MNHAQILVCGAFVGLGFAIAHASPPTALPTGGQVIAGSGQIDQNGSQLTVTQSSDRLIASWSTLTSAQTQACASCSLTPQASP